MGEWRVQKIHGVDSLVAPQCHAQSDIPVRVAIPKMVAGPFILWDNGYGTLQILDKDGKLAVTICYTSIIGDPLDYTAEEALWIGQVIVKALNEGGNNGKV